jgi:hypothetical protein
MDESAPGGINVCCTLDEDLCDAFVAFGARSIQRENTV